MDKIKQISPQVVVAMTVVISNILSVMANKFDFLTGEHTETIAGAVVVLLLAGLGWKTADNAQKQEPPKK